jgi:hypothetical protein
MGLSEDKTYVAALLDAFPAGRSLVAVAADDAEDEGAPPEMWAGAVDSDGCVEWRLLPSSLVEPDVAAIEADFRVQFPPLFRAYLLARLHLFSDFRSRNSGYTVRVPPMPAGQPLGPLRELMHAWQPLIDAGLVPFAELGDGYGPVCFDTTGRAADGDCPVVFLDHEPLVTLGSELCRQRAAVLPHLQPLYGSYREFLNDVLGSTEG